MELTGEIIAIASMIIFMIIIVKVNDYESYKEQESKYGHSSALDEKKDEIQYNVKKEDQIQTIIRKYVTRELDFVCTYTSALKEKYYEMRYVQTVFEVKESEDKLYFKGYYNPDGNERIFLSFVYNHLKNEYEIIEKDMNYSESIDEIIEKVLYQFKNVTPKKVEFQEVVDKKKEETEKKHFDKSLENVIDEIKNIENYLSMKENELTIEQNHRFKTLQNDTRKLLNIYYSTEKENQYHFEEKVNEGLEVVLKKYKEIKKQQIKLKEHELIHRVEVIKQR